MERLDTLKLTLVFIVSIVLPSVLLSCLAVQAISNERQAREERLRRRLEERTRALARDLEAPMRAAAEAVGGTARSLGGQDLPLAEIRAAFLRAIPDRDHFPLFFFVDPDGDVRRPRVPPPSTSDEPGSLLVGDDDSVWGADPTLARARAIHADGDLDGAIAHLRRAAFTERGDRVRIGPILHGLGELYLARADDSRADLLNAGDQFRRLVREVPLARGPDGRHLAPASYLRLIEIARRHRNQERVERAATGLLDFLETYGEDVPSRRVSRLADRARELVGEGAVAERAAAMSEEATRRAGRAASFRPVLSEVFLPVLEDALSATDPDPAVARFARSGEGKAGTAILYAVLPGDRGEEPRGVAGFQVDLERTYADLVRPVVARGDLREPEGYLEVAPRSESIATDAVDRPLDPPLDGWRVVAHPQPTAASTHEGWLGIGLGGRLEREITFWAIAIAILALAAGVVVTIRAVLQEKWESSLKTDFVTTVTHELKTPLTSIGMFIETLQMGRIQDEEEAQECLDIMARETDRLTTFIERVLRFSKLEAHKAQFDFRLCDVREVVEETMEIFRKHHVPEDADPFELELSCLQEPDRVLMDRPAVQEVLLNLLQNAYKYGGCDAQGHRRPLTIRVNVKERRRQTLIEVEDNGPGIPRKERRRIFKKFYRAPDTTSRQIEGSGIGLTLARTIAHAHRGDVWCTSTVGQGSKFTLALPK